MEWIEWMKGPTLLEWTLISGLLGGAYAVVKAWRTKTFLLENLVVKTLHASLLPVGLFFVGAAFDSSLLIQVKDMELYVMVAGIVLVVTSIREVCS